MSITVTNRTTANDSSLFVVEAPAAVAVNNSPSDTHRTPETLSASTQANKPAFNLPAPPSNDLKTQLGHKQNLQSLGQKLRDTAARLGIDATVPAILTALQTTPMDIHPDSGYPSEAGSTVTLQAYIQSMGLSVPSTHFGLIGVAHAVLNRAQEHPLGNFGGGLSWPHPLDVSEQNTLQNAAGRYASRNPNPPQVGVSLGVLEYLNSNKPLTSETAENPAKALEAIVSSPRAQAFGLQMQTHLNGVATQTSVNDYTLAAINVLLDPESIAAPHRNKVAGFDLSQQAHWGQPLSVVKEGLTQHLIESGKSTPEMAKVGAYLLLARKAPALLVKDIPANVTYGSVAWVNLSIAVAAIEAQTPGKVSSMTFAQVMLAAENATLQDPSVTAQAQQAALLDWGVVNKVISLKTEGDYSHDDVEKVRTEFNRQLTQRVAGSNEVGAEFPDREQIARALIKARFGDTVPLEEKLLKVKDSNQTLSQPLYDPNRAPVSMFSLLDIVMSGLHAYKWETEDPRILEATEGKSLTFDVNKTFNAQLTQTIGTRKQGVDKLIKSLVADLPLADRQNFEYAKLEFYQDKTYEIPITLTKNKLIHTSTTLWVKATGGTDDKVYEIDLSKGAITVVPASVLTEQRQRQSNNIFSKEQFTPTQDPKPDFSQDQSAGVPLPVPSSFSSVRTQALADAFVEHLDLENQDVVKQARGSTSFDQQRENDWKVTDFFLSFIPLRSAIVNARNGDYVEAGLDLAMDAFGFVTLGASTAARVANTSLKTLTAVSKGLRAARIIGAAAISAFNPLSGLDDLVKGIGTGVQYLATKSAKGLKILKGANGSYDALKAASKNHGIVAIGTYKVAEQSIDGSAVFRDGKWYNYDPATNSPYGPALKGFTPAVTALEGEIKLSFTETWLGKMIGAVVAPPTTNPNFRRDFVSAIAKAKLDDRTSYIRGQNTGRPDSIFGYSTALSIDDLKRLAVAERRTPEALGSLVKRIDELEVLPDRFNAARDAAKITDPDAYKRGYSAVAPETITGFSGALTNNQLAELVIARGRTAEEIGQLVKYMENRRVNISLENFKVFSEEVTAAGGKVTALPQGFYLSQVSLLSEGECAALSNLMAAAIKQGKQDTLLENLFTAMVPTLSPADIAILEKTSPKLAAIEVARAKKAPAVAQFRKELNRLQGALGNQFHLGMASRQVPYTALISELANASSSKTLLINGPGHGITAGVVVSNGKKEWFYFDPNFGKAIFDNEAAMRAGLESTLNSGRTKNLLAHYGNNASVPEYKISVFDRADLNDITKSLKIDPSDFFLTLL